MQTRTLVVGVIVSASAALALAQRVARRPPVPASQPSATSNEKRLTAQHLLEIRNGGEVRLPPGVYVSPTQVNIRSMSGFTLAGEGVTLRGQLRLDDCKDFRISGITFDGDRRSRGPQSNLPTLRLANCSGFTIEHCRFRDARGEHLYFETNCRDGLVHNSHFLDAWRNAIAVINGHDLRLSANVIDTVHGEVLGAGIDIESNAEDPIGCNHDITISGNTFRNCAESGVRITNGQEPFRIDVADNTFERCPTGVLVGGRDCRIRGNLFRDATRPTQGEIGERARAAVYLNGTRLSGITEITGNRFERLSGLGAVNVHPTWIGPVLINGNVVAGVTGKGVNAFTVNSAGAMVSGNRISDVENGIGIGISGRGSTVTSNVLQNGRGGAGAIWSCVDGGFYTGNRVTEWTIPVALPPGNSVQ